MAFFITHSFPFARAPGADDADIIARSVCTTTNIFRRCELPMMINRSSTCECAGSGIVSDNGSPNTVVASAKLTSCLARFDLALFSSHSKFSGMAQLYSLSKCGCFLSFAISFCTFHDFDFLWRQAVERIHQLVQLPLQRARVRLGIPLLRREDAVNQFDDWFLCFGLINRALRNHYTQT